jgi:hypothetical protein
LFRALPFFFVRPLPFLLSLSSASTKAPGAPIQPIGLGKTTRHLPRFPPFYFQFIYGLPINALRDAYSSAVTLISIAANQGFKNMF